MAEEVLARLAALLANTQRQQEDGAGERERARGRAASSQLAPFEIGSQSFANFIDRFEVHIGLHGVPAEDEEQKVKLLINHLSPGVYEMLVRLTSPDKPTQKSYAVLKSLLMSQIDPSINILTEQHKFAITVQHEGESIRDYVLRLRTLSSSCKLVCDECQKSTEDTHLRSQFIRGIRDSDIRTSLLQGQERTAFKDIVSLAESIEAAKSDSRLMESPPGGGYSAEIKKVVKGKPKGNSGESHKATSKYCDGKYFCEPPKQCCTLGCCYLYAPPSPNLLSLIFWNHWYLWCAVAVAVACGCGCGLWKRKSRGSRAPSEPPTPDSCYRPPNYSRCSSFHQPPPYAEVTSKPDLYPLVISYSENGKTGGNYLMVQYFRNYIMRPVGSLSATSTADSLSSSLFCSAANEANSLIPPPYSSAPGSVEQINAQSTQTQEEPAGCTVEVEGERRQARPSLCGLSNVSSQSIAPLDSPPQATSPTFGKLPQHSSGRSKYLGKGWLSRSAPTTPSSQLAPASSFESSPLLAPDQDNTF